MFQISKSLKKLINIHILDTSVLKFHIFSLPFYQLFVYKFQQTTTTGRSNPETSSETSEKPTYANLFKNTPGAGGPTRVPSGPISLPPAGNNIHFLFTFLFTFSLLFV